MKSRSLLFLLAMLFLSCTGTRIHLKDRPDIRKYVMFFHGSGPFTEEEGDFDKNSSIGIAWSEDLLQWEWPGQP
ncbi:MAG: hypothetical protein LUG51_02885 [Tannerellaceae bacterium]|nr:hypothetical protein [Tannerellaceae bacterium]